MGDIMKAIDALQMERQTQTPQMPKSMPASLAQTVYAGTFKVPVQANMPETSFLTNVGMGFIDATDTFFNDTPEQIRLIGGQAQTALGGYFEEPEMIKRGQMNIATANRNLQANMEQRSLLTPESAQDTFGYALGAGASNYGTMVIGGVTGSAVAKGFGAGAKAAGKAAGAAAIGTMGVMEVGGEAQERAEKHVADTKDESFTEYTPEKATKNLAAEGAYGTVSMLMEKYMGYGKQRQLFNLDLLKLKSPTLRATASLTKTGLKSAVSEAGTEFAQSLANMGIDLIDDTMSWEQVPDRLKQELMGWAAAGVIGGTAGIGAGIYNRSRGIKVIKDNIQGTVPEEDLEKTAAAIFDSAATKVSDVVSVELELSSELQNKHGAVYDSMQRAIKRAADESGAFKNVSEEDLAQYVGDTAKLFADQVLAEAQMRNEPIDTVLKASDIVYEDGGIKLNVRNKAGVSGENTMYQLPQNAYDTQGKADITTTEFKNWFGDSKILDENGQPLVVYHGSPNKFENFIVGDSKIGAAYGKGIYFSRNKIMTEAVYGDNVYSVYLNMKNPFFDNEDNKIKMKELFERIGEEYKDGYTISKITNKNESQTYKSEEITKALQEMGYDGVIYGYDNNPKHGIEYVVFNPNQIKSVYNHGTFDPSNDNIYYQTGKNDRDLVVQHATTLEKLSAALELGAMPMPSLAVTKSEYAGDSNFGEIVFIGGSDVIDPAKNRDNHTFPADIYSTRKISPVHEINQDGREYLERLTSAMSQKGLHYWVENVKQNLDDGNDSVLKALFLASKSKITDLDGSTYMRIQDMSEQEKSDFAKWKRKFVAEYTDKKVFEGFTPSGSRRFSPYDLNNILRLMKKENLKTSESTADGNAHALRGVWAEELKSIEEIRQAKGKIVDAETYKNLDNAIWDETTKLSDLLVTEQKAEELEHSWVAPDEYMIEEVLKKLKPNSNIKAALEKAELRSDKKAVDAVKRYMELLKATPVQYFESKPQRAVDFSEFSGVIMPTSQEYDSIADTMAEYGLQVVRSDDKRAAVKEFEDIFFQGQIADNGRNVELTINSLEEMRGLSNEDFKNKMLETLKSFKGNKIFNQSLNGDIEIRTSSIKKYKSFFADKNKRLIVPYIPELLGKARFNKMEASYAPEKEPNIKAYYKADLPINIDDDTYNVHLTVREDQYGNFFWDAQINEKPQRATPATNPGDTGLLSGLSSEDALNITPIKGNVKLDYQNKPQPKGLYDANRNLIKIFESADFSTLPHELAHYWLNNMWNYTRSGNASERYRQRWNAIANWLGITPEQTLITRRQQEKFARGYEQYLLNGNLPTPIIKGAFDDYDRWLKRVYGDMNNLNVRLSDDAVRFFQSMTTGTLPPPKIKPSKKPRSKMTLAEKLREKAGIKADDTQDDKARNFIKEEAKGFKMPENAEARTIITSNITEGEKGKSRVYSREVEKNAVELGESYDDDLTYNKVNLAEQAKRAQDYVREHLEEAKKIVDGVKHAPDNILDTAIRIAYEQEMLRIGNNDEYLRALKLHSGLQTLRGQEISAERISSRDVTNPSFWINKIITARTEKIARKLFSNFLARVGIKNPISAYKDMIKRETDNISKKVLAESTAEGQKKVLKRELERLRHEYDTGDGELLFQMPESKPYTSQNAKMYVREALDNLFGTTVTPEETSQIIAKVDDLTKSINNTLDETGNPSLQTWQQIRQINDLVESLTPSSNLRIATSIVGRGMMLASIKSPVLNIISNAENIVTEMLVRRAVNKADGGATYSAVDGRAIKDYLKYANDVYRTSGYNVSTTQDMDAMTVTLGEQRISSQGKGRFRAFSRGVETGVFKYLMGYPDSFSKDLVFSDTAAMEATTIAENEGLAGEALEKRATYLFKDATRVEPLSEEGRIIRDKAIEEANIATYTNDTALSKFALGMRQALNNLTGDVRLGDQLMPFVKTPANVVSLGLEYSAGLAYAIPNLPTIIKDVKAGKLSQTSRRAIKAAMRNGLGVVLAMLIAMAFDPDDYTPEYESLTPSERRLAMEKNAVFNSIRIGNRYISLDYFGPLAFPLTAVLMARKRDNSEWFGYIKGMSSQALKTPGIEELSDTVGSIKRTVVSGDVYKTVDNLINFFVDFIRARTIPSIVNDIAKMTDDYERETSGGRFDKAKNSIPVIREKLPPKYMTLSKTPRETEPFWSVLAFGARFKTATRNRVLYEVDRLYKTGNRVTITDVTRSGKLSSLNEADQQRVRRDFAQKYYDAVYKIINSRAYRRMDDEQKAAELNKARRKIIEDLKDKYL